MAKAIKCPICNGAGKLKDPRKNMDATYAPEETCHGCIGKGWVEVADDLGFIPPYPGTPNLPYYSFYYPSPQYPGYFYPPGPWGGAVIGQGPGPSGSCM